MKKKAIVLFLTISFIAVISTIVALYFTLTDDSIKRSEKEQFLVQSNLFMYNIKNDILPIFNETIKTIFSSPMAELIKEYADEEFDEERAKIEIYSTYVYNTPFPLQSAGQTVSGTILCKPFNRNLNVNLFRDFNDSFRATFQNKFKIALNNSYDLQDPDTLIELINYAVGATPREYSYLVNKEELEINSLNLEENKIGSFTIWNKLLSDYEKLTDDKNIYKVPWEDLVSFQGEFLDYNQMSQDLCKTVFLYSKDNDETLCGEPRNRTQKQLLDLVQDDEKILIYGLNMFFNFNTTLSCQLDYEGGKANGTFTFKYFMETKEANKTSPASLKDFTILVN